MDLDAHIQDLAVHGLREDPEFEQQWLICLIQALSDRCDDLRAKVALERLALRRKRSCPYQDAYDKGYEVGFSDASWDLMP
jgi:hypothetical protein